jgi:NAD(P)-dependent dehydrogenase (short-subunit alcohol dehydrogenase family)
VRLGLTDAVAVVTGASSGIGLATAVSMVAEGARVVTVGRNPAGPGIGETLHVAADLFQPGEPERAVRLAEDELGRIDVLVNNVGRAEIRRLEEVTDQDWNLALKGNLLSAIRATSATLPGMRARQRGSIVNVASTAGRRPNRNLPDYSVMKAALLAYSRQVAAAYAGEGVCCNAVLAGPTLTASWLADDGLSAQQGDRDELLVRAAAERTLKRFAEPQEIANAIVFLCSTAASRVNGAEWSVSGGSFP